MASSTIQHGHPRPFEPVMRFATVSLRPREVECDEDEVIEPCATVFPAPEKLGAARAAMIALGIETVAALCLFGVWEIMRLLW